MTKYEDIVHLLSVAGKPTTEQLPNGEYRHTWTAESTDLPTHMDKRVHDALFSIGPEQKQELYDAVMSFFPGQKQ